MTVGDVNIDLTDPTIGASRTPANAHGLNNEPVTVTFACADALSGIAGCTDPVTIAGDGANQTATGTATRPAIRPARRPASP